MGVQNIVFRSIQRRHSARLSCKQQKDFLRKQTLNMAKFLKNIIMNISSDSGFKTKNKLTHVYQVIQPEYEESIITNKEMCDFFKSKLS